MTINAIAILMPAVLTFVLAFTLSPFYINYLLKNEMWKKKSVEKALGGYEATITNKIHNDENKKVPRLGGAIIWISVFIVASLLWLLAEYKFVPSKLDFISRNQTWLIFFGMIATGILGALDDISSCGKHILLIGKNGLSFKYRLLLIFILSLFVVYWFYFKLAFTLIFIPFIGFLEVGIFIIPIIIAIFMTLSTVSVIDGIDGLSGGLFAICFGAFGIIASSQGQIDIATLCFAIVGALLAFLWYNVTPAKYYNSETGMLSLSTTLTLIAILTNQLFALIIIALPLLSAPASAFIQIISKKYRGKKIFLVAPMHHHFQAMGLSAPTVVFRYWIFALISAFVGIVFALAGTL